MPIDNDLEKLIKNLPIFIQEELKQFNIKDQLIEIILDAGRQPEARFINKTKFISRKVISWQDINYITKRINKFNNENRAGIEKTLHRISCIRNRQFLINGLTCRVGRTLFGTISGIKDLLELEKSILILGKPGVGKTTIIREIARVLSNEMEKRVIVIDTSNEIAGDSDISHSGIGHARRMQVSDPELQHQIMIEAVENHTPEVIIIDEIGTEFEVLAARTIAEKGVQLVGTTHGNCLENLIKNPSLSNLIGGIQYVTLGDDEAKRRGTQKSILERKAYPTFEIVLEINRPNFWTVHEDVKNSIDSFLRRNFKIDQIREFSTVEKIKIKCYKNNVSYTYLSKILYNSVYSTRELNNLKPFSKNFKSSKLESKSLIIYSYSISNNLLKEILIKLGIRYALTNDIRKAGIVIGLKKHVKQNFKLIDFAKRKNVPIYALNEINLYQLAKIIQLIY